MRFARVAVALTVLIMCSLGLTAAKSTKPKPELRKVVIYYWVEQIGGIEVNLQKSRLDGLVNWAPKSEQDRKILDSRAHSEYSVTRIKTTLNKAELSSIRKLAEDSHLRNFAPSKKDINDRMPYLDESPPTLVLFWNDKVRILRLPLRDTVKKTIPQSRQRPYEYMGKIITNIEELTDAHRKLPYMSWATEKEYAAFAKKRDKLIAD